jgi:penicillin G amidase
MTTITEEAMLELQLDTRTQFYDFYQELALQVLEGIELTPWLAEVRRYLEAWDGKAETESLGLALLVAFRNTLADAVFTPFLSACKKHDPDFVYSWLKLDAPLRRLLTEQIPETLPDPDHYSNWQDFTRAQLLQSARQLKETHHVTQLQELTWGQLNKVSIAHPFSKIVPGIVGKLVNMDREALPGCLFCVRLIHGSSGASKRMVVSPSRLSQALLHMPGGQSGHPLSRHYRDQHPYWVNGLPLPFLPTRNEHRLTLHP